MDLLACLRHGMKGELALWDGEINGIWIMGRKKVEDLLG